ncbi:MAG: GH1 family beta-glucosidase [Actinomycetota bacterium]
MFGTATSAYQVEGAVAEDGRGPSIWDTFSHTPGKIVDGSDGDVACDQYHRYEDDIVLMSELGLDAYRFSISWPRIQPDGRGAANPKGLDHYRRLVASLRDHGITPVPTLFHWDLPQALEDGGGWVARSTAERFADYAALVGEALADGIGPCVTINEPMVAAWLGYGAGIHAPGRTSEREALIATHHLLLAHGLALPALRAAGVAEVGIALNLYPVNGASPDPDDRSAVETADAHLNRFCLDPLFGRGYPSLVAEHHAGGDMSFAADGDLDTIAQPVDFLGVNYYTSLTVTGRRPAVARETDLPASLRVWAIRRPSEETTSMGWVIDPGGLTEMLERVHREYGPPALYVTENGAAFEDEIDPAGVVHDAGRIAYLSSHVDAALAAAKAGVPLAGFIAWSLLDNFEWAEGYTRRFGLVRVEPETLRRIPKDSARWYGALARSVRDRLP